MITIDKLSKSFGTHYGLRDITTEIPEGSIYGLVGSNGSGKSTLLRLIAGIYQADRGGVSVNGKPVFEYPETKVNMFYISDEQYTERSANIAEMV